MVFDDLNAFLYLILAICPKSVKTFKLEDQYAVILGLAVWPEEPREIHFFKKSWFSQKWSSKQVKKSSKLN